MNKEVFSLLMLGVKIDLSVALEERMFGVDREQDIVIPSMVAVRRLCIV